MSVGTTTAIAIGAGVSAAGALGGSAISAHGQASATDKATAAESSAAANSLAFNRDVYNTTQANEAPYMALGNQATGQLGNFLKTPFSFTPTDWQNDPAFTWQEQQGEQAIQRSAAAQGGLVSGGALKDLEGYSQGLASTNYQQQYSNALSSYQMAYNQLMGGANLGQSAASGTANAGLGAAGTAAGISGSTANSLSNLYTGQANANTGAIAAGTNAIAGGANQYANWLAQQQGMTGSSYNTPPTATQWGAYDLGSTPAGVRNWV